MGTSETRSATHISKPFTQERNGFICTNFNHYIGVPIAGFSLNGPCQTVLSPACFLVSLGIELPAVTSGPR